MKRREDQQDRTAPSTRSLGPARELGRGDDGWPDRLGLLPDPPELLHVAGCLPAEPLVAIVGSRDADTQMCRFTAALARGLAERGLAVVSGGARGIDTAAHEGCLQAGGRTVAVLGSGFDHPYPAGNAPLFHRITADGALISEFPAGTPPSRWTFPRRNRIVAALSRAIVVVQASERSGALITAGVARGIGVPVGAVPGSPADARSRGCNALIRAGAVLVEDVADILGMIDGGDRDGQMGLPSVLSRGKETTPDGWARLGSRERMVLERLGAKPLHIDDIVAGTGLSAAEVAATILNLELAGFAEDRGGKQFVRSG
ncbi:MAG TPA: DNA-processing protein DprA [Polyangia bacterium]|nr:DNA-processing protein DprA [Polyangia bacterium]